jgi:small subunit ribosomal protein S24e
MCMSFEIEIKEAKKNPLIDRKEIKFHINHPNMGTPNRIDVKKKLAAMETADESLVFIKNIRTIFGQRKVNGIAAIYGNQEVANQFEAVYIKIRNMPKDQREEARKKIKEAKKKKKRGVEAA